jgi:hypothetical protein
MVKGEVIMGSDSAFGHPIYGDNKAPSNKFMARGKPISEIVEYREDLDSRLDNWSEIIKEDGFVYGSVIWSDENPFIVGEVADSDDEFIAPEFWCPVNRETVGRASSCKDNNKKTVYVGDILKSFDKYFNKFLWEVVDNIDYIGVRTIGGMDEGVFISWFPKNFEIVGNIFDDKDLFRLQNERSFNNC